MKVYVVFLLIISLLSFTAAQPPFQTTIADKSIQIESPVFDYHKAGEDLYFHVHPHNSTDGKLIQVNDMDYCIIHLYNQSNKDHLITDNMTIHSDNIEFEYKLEGGNLTIPGQYMVYFYCQVNESIENRAGYFEFAFEVTETGNKVDTGESLMYIIILLFLVMFLSIGIYVSIIMPYGNVEETKGKETFVTKVTRTKYLKLFAIWISYGIFLLIITILSGMSNNYIQFESMKSIFSNTYIFLKILSYGVSVGIMWLLFWNTWKDIVLNKKILQEGKALINKL